MGEDVARVCPLEHANLNVLGRYSFRSSTRSTAACARCATRVRRSWTRTTAGGSEYQEPAGPTRDRRSGIAPRQNFTSSRSVKIPMGSSQPPLLQSPLMLMVTICSPLRAP